MSSRYKQWLVWRVNLVSFPTVYSVLSETTVLCECECECECECVASYIIHFAIYGHVGCYTFTFIFTFTFTQHRVPVPWPS